MRLAPGILNNIMNRGSFRQGQNIFNQAATGMTQAFQGTAGSAGAPNIAAFQTPYTQNVINRTQQDIARQQAMSMNDLGAQATAAGAFGGSRHGVAQGVMAGEYGRMAGRHCRATAAGGLPVGATGRATATAAAACGGWPNGQLGAGSGWHGAGHHRDAERLRIAATGD